MAGVDGSYWQRHPTSDERHGVVALRLPDLSADLVTAAGVFAAQRVDRGTMALLRQMPTPTAASAVVDLGAGYGPIAVTLAHRQPLAGVWAVDINERALGLVRVNSTAVRGPNVVAAAPEQVPETLLFDGLYSNPPIKIGKEGTRQLLSTWLARVVPGGSAWLVVKQAMGADSLHTWLDEVGFPTRRMASKQGYRILQVRAPSTEGPGRQPLAAEDLELVGRGTGGRWTVLGQLSGGMSDPVYLLGRARQRAVLKVKQGAWWGEQLARTVECVEQLRALDYPTPPVLGVGALDPDRHFLLTGYRAGRPSAALTARDLDRVLDAAARHGQVHPGPVRDWSVMVAAFLNGGIADFAFHPGVQPLARQALGLITRPVPALPTGDFVHGDFTPRNMLFDRDGLSAIIDLEGFGAGTPVIDLVALLQTAAHPRDGDPAMARRLTERALEIGSAETFAACVVHRVLAALAAATEHPAQLEDARERCQGLLRMIDWE